MQVEITLADEADLAEILAVRRSAILQDGPRCLSPEQVSEWANRDRTEKLKQRIRAAQLWIAKCPESAICGCGSLQHEKVSGLYIRADYQGKGLGSQILAFLENVLRENGHDTVMLSASLNAVEFYRRRGYEPVAEANMSTLRMSKSLPSRCESILSSRDILFEVLAFLALPAADQLAELSEFERRLASSGTKWPFNHPLVEICESLCETPWGDDLACEMRSRIEEIDRITTVMFSCKMAGSGYLSSEALRGDPQWGAIRQHALEALSYLALRRHRRLKLWELVWQVAD